MPQYDIFGMPLDDQEASQGFDLFDQIEYERRLREEYQARRAAEIRESNPGITGNELGGIATGLNVGVNSLVAPVVRFADPLIRRAGSALGYDTSGGNYADFIASENDAMMQAQRGAVDQSEMSGPRKWLNRALPGAVSSLGQAAALASAAPASVPAGAAMALGFGATTAESSYAEARAAGLPMGESAQYGAEQGFYEGAVQGAFSAIPGMAGTEGLIGNAVRGGIKGSADDLYNLVRQPFRQQAGRIGQNLASESAEELVTTGLQTSATARTIPGQENAASVYDKNGNFSITGSPAGQAALDTLSQVGLMGAFGESSLQARGRMLPSPEEMKRQEQAIATAQGRLPELTQQAGKGVQNETDLPPSTGFNFQPEELPLVGQFVNDPSIETRDLLPPRIRETVLGMDLTEAAETLDKAAYYQRAAENNAAETVRQQFADADSRAAAQSVQPIVEQNPVDSAVNFAGIEAIGELGGEVRQPSSAFGSDSAVVGAPQAIPGAAQAAQEQAAESSQLGLDGFVDPFRVDSEAVYSRPSVPTRSQLSAVSTEGGREGLLAQSAPVVVRENVGLVEAPETQASESPEPVVSPRKKRLSKKVIPGEADVTITSPGASEGATVGGVQASEGATSRTDVPTVPVVNQPFSVESLADSMLKAEPRAKSGALVTMPELRAQSGIADKKQFDTAVLEAAKAGVIGLHRHDFPANLSAQERDQLVTDGENYYVGAAFRSDWLKGNQQPTVKSETGLEEIGGMAGAIGENLRGMLWDKVQSGDTKEGGQESSLLQAAKIVRDAGGLKTRDEFVKFAESVQAVRNEYQGKPEYQDKMRGVVSEWVAQPASKPSQSKKLFKPSPVKLSGGQTAFPGMDDAVGDLRAREEADKRSADVVGKVEGFDGPESALSVKRAFRALPSTIIRMASEVADNRKPLSVRSILKEIGLEPGVDFRDSTEEVQEYIADSVEEFAKGIKEYDGVSVGDLMWDRGFAEEVEVEGFEGGRGEQLIATKVRGKGRNYSRTVENKSDLELILKASGAKPVVSSGEPVQAAESKPEKTFDEQMEEFTAAEFGLGDKPAPEKKKIGKKKPDSELRDAIPSIDDQPAVKPKKIRSKLGAKLEKTAEEKKAELKAKFEKLRDFKKGDSATIYSIGGFDTEKAKATVDVLKAAIEYGTVKFADMVVLATEFIGEAAVRDLGPYFKSGWNTLHKSKKYGVDAAGDVEAILASQPKSVVEQEQVQPDDSITEPEPVVTVKGTAPHDNHFIGPDDVIAPNGVISKLNGNMAAIRLLRKLQAEDRLPTRDEKKVLAQFVGWGSLQNVFEDLKGQRMEQYPGLMNDSKRRVYLLTGEFGDYYNATRTGDAAYMDKLDKKIAEWERTFGAAQKELKTLLTADEMDAAGASTINAHYTSRDVISEIWKSVGDLGLHGGKFLEPSAGIGSFIGLSPYPTNDSTAIELDSVSAQLLAKLYPQSTTMASDFAVVNVAPNSYDLTITNVPFAEKSATGREVTRDSQERYGRSMNLHNYFIARMIDATRPGGLVVAITTSTTMDSTANAADRVLFAEKADLVGAVRLPNDAFAGNAGTEVTTDLLVFRRKSAVPFLGAKQFLDVKEVGKEVVKGESVPIVVNSYFADNPEMALGRHSLSGKLYGGGAQYTLQPQPGQDTIALLRKALASLPSGVASDDKAEIGVASKSDNSQKNQAGRLLVSGGKVGMYDSSGNRADPDWLLRHIDVTTTGEPRKLSPEKKAEWRDSAIQKAVAYVGLRDVFESHMSLMTSDASDAAVASSRAKLNAIYDGFKAKHGFVSDNKLLKGDPSYWAVAALEVPVSSVDEEDSNQKITYRKADVFSRRINTAVEIPSKIETIDDGIRLSSVWNGRLDATWIAERMGIHPDEVTQKMLSSGKAFIDPATGLLATKSEYLRGNVKAKLLLAKDASEADEKFKDNVSALELVQPAYKKIDQFDYRLGAYWLPEKLVQQYAKVVTGLSDVKVRRDDTNDLWAVDGRDVRDDPRMAHYRTIHKIVPLLQKLLNNMDVRVVIREGDSKSPIDRAATEQQTAAAVAAKMKIIEDFKAWVLEDDNRTKIVEEAYNDKVNNFQEGEVDDSSQLVLPGSNQEIKLDPHQKQVVWRMLRDRAGMYAHAPGAGKTFAMIATAMEMRRLGLANKPMIVVQNSTLGQFATSFQRFYPNAKVLVATTDDLGGENRLSFMNRIKTGDYDAVVIPHSTFDLKLANNPQSELSYLNGQIALLKSQYQEAQSAGQGTFTKKQIEKKTTALEKRAAKAAEKSKKHNDKDLYFEDLGVDALFVDEAHHYKKPFYYSNMDEKVRGVERSNSAAAMSATMKVKHIQDKMGGKNVFFATGTPITNTLGEVYHMINYTNPQLLKDFGVSTFDRFVGQFASVEEVEVINAGGRLVRRSVLAKFRNGEELGKLIRMSWDVLTVPQLHKEMADKQARSDMARQGKLGEADAPRLDIPKRVTGAIIPVFTEQSTSFKRFFGFLKIIDAAYDSLKGKDRRTFSWVNVLAFNAAKYAAIDPRLVDQNAEDDPGSKVNQMISKMMEIDKLHPGKGHVVFSDVANRMDIGKLESFVGHHEEGDATLMLDDEQDDESDDEDDDEEGGKKRIRKKKDSEATAGNEANRILKEQGKELFLYRDVARKLVLNGIPANQIAIINDYNTKAQKDKLLEDFNSGKIRFLIGHTKTVGTGVNIQTNLIAMYHLETPWSPDSMDQRSARGIRQGNKNPEVYEFIFAMKGSLDGALLDKLDKKRVLYNQALEGRLGVEFDDPMSEEIMSIRDMVGTVQNDPLLKESRKLESEIRELKMQEHAHDQALQMAERNVRQLERELATHDNNMRDLRRSAQIMKDFDVNSPVEFNGKTYDVGEEGLAGKFDKWLFSRVKAIVGSIARLEHKPLTVDIEIASDGAKGEYHVGNVNRGPVTFQIFAALLNKGTVSREEVVAAMEEVSRLGSLQEMQAFGSDVFSKVPVRLTYAVRVAVDGHLGGFSKATTLPGLKSATTTLRDRLELSFRQTEDAKKGSLEHLEQYKEILERPFESADRLAESQAELKSVKDQMIERDSLAVKAINQNPSSVVAPSDRTTEATGILARAVASATNPEAGRPGKLMTRGSDPKLSHTAIRKRFEKLFGVAIGTADYQMGKSIGIYDGKQWSVRTTKARIGDLGTLAHEIAHHVDNVLLGRKGLKLIFNSNLLRNQLAGFDYLPLRMDRPLAVKEGFAEFIRLWMTEPDIDGPGRLELRAPEVWARWNSWLDQGGDNQMKLLTAREFIQRYESQTASDRLESQIVKSPDEKITAADITTAEHLEDLFDTASYIARSRFEDDRVALKKFDEEARKAGVNPEIGAWDLLIATDGTADRQAMEASVHGVHRVSERSVIPGLRVLGKGLRQVSLDAGIKDALDRESAEKYAVARFVLELSEKKPGYRGPIGADTAREVMEGFSDEDTGRYEVFADGLREFAADLIRMLADSGVISPAEARAIIDSGDHYVPFMRVVDDSFGKKLKSAMGGNSLLNLGKGVRGRSKGGSDAPILSPSVALFLQAQHFYGLANKMQVVLKMRDMAIGVEGNAVKLLMEKLPAKVKTDRVAVREVYDQMKDQFDAAGYDADVFPNIDPYEDGITPAESGRRLALGSGLLKIYRRDYRAGEDRIMSINVTQNDGSVETEEWKINGVLIDAVDRQPELRGLLPSVFRGFTDVLKFGAIESSGTFAGLNPIRDWNAFQKNTRFSKGLASLTDPFRYFGAYINARFRNIEDEAAAMYQQWGGNLATRYGMSKVDPNRVVEELMGGEDNRTSLVLRIGRKLGKKVVLGRELIALSEVGPRFSEFVNSLLADGFERRWDSKSNAIRLYNLRTNQFEIPGRDVIVKAVLASGDVTNNYRVRGSAIRKIDDFIPLLGASIAGLNKSYRSYKGAITGDDKQANSGRVLAYTMVSIAAAVAYWGMRGDDDDYDEQDLSVSAAYWTFKDANGKVILRIPKGHDTAVIPNIVEGFLNSLTGNSRKGFKEMLQESLSNMVPSMSMALVTPVVETTMNYDFFRGKELEYDGPGAEHPTTRTKPWTSDLARLIGKYTGEYGISPIRVEHFIDRITGGFGLRAIRVGESAVNAASERTMDAASEFLFEAAKAAPIPGNPLPLYVNKDHSESVDDFYRMKKDNLERIASLRRKGKDIVEAGGDIPDDLAMQIRELAAKNSEMDRDADLMRGIGSGVRDTKDRDDRFESTKYATGVARKSLRRKPLESYPSAPVGDKVPASVREAFNDTATKAFKAALQNDSMNLDRARNSDGKLLDESDRNSIAAAREWIRNSGLTMLEAGRILNVMQRDVKLSQIHKVAEKQLDEMSRKRSLLGRILRKKDESADK